MIRRLTDLFSIFLILSGEIFLHLSGCWAFLHTYSKKGPWKKAVQSEFGAHAVKMVKHFSDNEPEINTDAVKI